MPKESEFPKKRGIKKQGMKTIIIISASLETKSSKTLTGIKTPQRSVLFRGNREVFSPASFWKTRHRIIAERTHPSLVASQTNQFESEQKTPELPLGPWCVHADDKWHIKHVSAKLIHLQEDEVALT